MTWSLPSANNPTMQCVFGVLSRRKTCSCGTLRSFNEEIIITQSWLDNVLCSLVKPELNLQSLVLLMIFILNELSSVLFLLLQVSCTDWRSSGPSWNTLRWRTSPSTQSCRNTSPSSRTWRTSGWWWVSKNDRHVSLTRWKQLSIM